jgi:hypothetical protein
MYGIGSMLAELTTFRLFPDRLRAKIPLAGEDYAAILLYDDAQLGKHSTLQTQKLTVSCKSLSKELSL